MWLAPFPPVAATKANFSIRHSASGPWDFEESKNVLILIRFKWGEKNKYNNDDRIINPSWVVFVFMPMQSLSIILFFIGRRGPWRRKRLKLAKSWVSLQSLGLAVTTVFRNCYWCGRLASFPVDIRNTEFGTRLSGFEAKLCQLQALETLLDLPIRDMERKSLPPFRLAWGVNELMDICKTLRTVKAMRTFT